MMQQNPYAGFEPVGRAPALAAMPSQAPAGANPYAGFEPVRQAPAPQQPPRRAQAARPAAPAMPSAPQTIGDSGLTQDEIYSAQRAQGYNDDEIAANIEEMFGTSMGDPGMAPQPAGDVLGYGVVNEQDLAPTDTPQSLRDEGYEYDPAAGRWFRVVGSQTLPVEPPAAIAGPSAGMPEGQRLALEQERAGLAQREEMGIRRYDRPEFTDQFTAPINDEMAWLAGLGSQAIGNLGRRLTGQEVEVSALDRARAMRDLSREGQERFQRDKPLQALGGGLLGGFAFAPSRGAAIPGVLGRLGQAAGVSGAYGVAEGDGVMGRVGSGALSAGVGLATAGLLEGGGNLVGRTLRGNAQRAAEQVGVGATAPERRVTGALGRALERDQLSPAQYLDNLANAPEGRLPFQSGGENLLGLAETMATAPGNARRALVGAVEGQRDEASNRVTARLAESFGAQGNGFQALRQRVAARGEAASTGMGEIENAVVALDDQAVQALRSRLSSRAVRDAAEEAIAELTPEGSAAANRLFGLGERVADMPAGANITVREAQDISYALKEAAGRAYRGGFNSRGEALQNLSNAIRANARTPERGGVQAYDDWLKSFGDASEAIEGQRVGQNIFAKANEKNAMSAAELSDRWSKWSEQARENFRLGVGEAVLDRVRGNGGVAAMRRLIRDNEIADRIRVAFNDEDAFLAFMRTADDEVSMDNTGRQVIGGSPTARRAAGRADVEAQGFDPMAMVEAAADFTNPVGAGRQAIRLAAKNLPRRDRSIIGDEQMNGLIGAALSDEAAMTRLLNLMQTQEGLQARVTSQMRRLGLLSSPGAVAGGQERARGLLTTSP